LTAIHPSSFHVNTGGSFCASSRKRFIATIDFKTQDLLLVDGNDSRVLVSGNDGLYRFGDFVMDLAGNRNMIYAIQEDHTTEEPSKVVNRIVAISMNQTDDVSVSQYMTVPMYHSHIAPLL
jgi:hypothetical protein